MTATATCRASPPEPRCAERSLDAVALTRHLPRPVSCPGADRGRAK